MFIRKTHSIIKEIQSPMHTIYIKTSNILFKKERQRQYAETQNEYACDIIYATCSDGHVKDNDEKRHDPMLKLYKDRPLCINKNIDVRNCIVNGCANLRGLF